MISGPSEPTADNEARKPWAGPVRYRAVPAVRRPQAPQIRALESRLDSKPIKPLRLRGTVD